MTSLKNVFENEIKSLHELKRVYNFGAGPGMLPTSVLLEAQKELLNWNNKGISILELGHRTKDFQEILQNLDVSFRKLMQIPDNYKIIFLGNAARSQFSMVPLNLLNKRDEAGYIVSGIWSKLALQEAQKVKSAYCLASSESEDFKSLPKINLSDLRNNTKYIYYTPNETINGICFKEVPQTNKNIPIVADLTSCMLAKPIDIPSYGLIFSGAQKNISGSGLSIIIIRDDLLEYEIEDVIPTIMDYRVHVASNSLYATPPVFNCYLALKTLKWVEECGGVEKIHEHNLAKAKKIYDYIDSSNGYYCKVDRDFRSEINVCFYLNKPEFEEKFILDAQNIGLYALKGHTRVGGIRASLYNAVPLEAVEKLITFMHDFAKENAL